MTDTLPAVRTRSYEWADPTVSAAAAMQTSGLDFLRQLVAGELPMPPMARTLGMSLVAVSEGRVVFEVEPAEWHYNTMGVVHGGLAATMLDSALGCAVHSTLPEGTGYTTVELKVNMVRAITDTSGTLRAEAAIVHRGKRMATAEGRLTDADGRLYAHGSTTCMILGNLIGP
jgi:uncharacterized protein (TIGR00369 family)